MLPLTRPVEEDVTLREHYEGIAFDALGAIWRRKWMIALFIACASAGAHIALLFVQKQYTADALIKMSLSDDREEQTRTTGQSARFALEPSAVIETEARIIRSRAIAERVVTRLNLQEDPTFDRSPSIVQAILQRLPFPGMASVTTPSESAVRGLILVNVLRGLTVSNDARSYMINIAYTYPSPQKSAAIANAFAEEYLNARREETARRSLADMSGTLGPKHPSITRAQARLADTGALPVAGADLVVRAAPISVPSSPNRIAFYLLAMSAAAAVGSWFSLILERRDRGFSSEMQASMSTGLPCLGTLPEMAPRTVAAEAAYLEAARCISLAIGFGIGPTDPKVVLVTSSSPGDGKSLFCLTAGRTLVQSGRRVLIIDACPQRPSAPASPGVMSLEHAVAHVDEPASLVDLQRSHFAVLRRASGVNDGQKLFSSPGFAKLLSRAREQFDVIFIEAPSAVVVSDALLLGRFADVVVLLVRWNKTPRKVVRTILARLQLTRVPVGGIILSRVNAGRAQYLPGYAYHTDGEAANVYAMPSSREGRPATTRKASV